KFTDAVFGVREFSNDELEYFVRLGSGNGGEESWHCMCELGAVVHGLPKFFVAFAGAQQDEIFDFVVGKLALAKHRVCKFGRPSTRLNSSHLVISYAVFCLKKKKNHPAACPTADH